MAVKFQAIAQKTA